MYAVGLRVSVGIVVLLLMVTTLVLIQLLPGSVMVRV